jgi:atypical dual specificity phosphatase
MLGISRSATVVCAYLIATTKLSAGESIAQVQSIRGIVCPNIGFRRQLEQYATRYVKDESKPRATRIRKLKGTAS